MRMKCHGLFLLIKMEAENTFLPLSHVMKGQQLACNVVHNKEKKKKKKNMSRLFFNIEVFGIGN